MQELGVSFESREYDKVPFTAAELERLIGKRPVTDFLNPRSPAYKALGLKEKSVSKREFIRLVREDPNLMKRPLVVKGAQYLFGLQAEAYEKL